MDSFEPVEERIRSREKAVTARELTVRIKALEKELDEIQVTPTQKQPETVSHRLHTYRALQGLGKAGRFVFSFFGVALVLFLALATRWCLAA